MSGLKRIFCDFHARNPAAPDRYYTSLNAADHVAVGEFAVITDDEDLEFVGQVVLKDYDRRRVEVALRRTDAAPLGSGSPEVQVLTANISSIEAFLDAAFGAHSTG